MLSGRVGWMCIAFTMSSAVAGDEPESLPTDAGIGGAIACCAALELLGGAASYSGSLQYAAGLSTLTRCRTDDGQHDEWNNYWIVLVWDRDHSRRGDYWWALCDDPREYYYKYQMQCAHYCSLPQCSYSSRSRSGA